MLNEGNPSKSVISETKFDISPNLSEDLEMVLNDTFPSDIGEVYIGETSNFLVNVIGVKAKKNIMPANKAYAAMVSEEKAKEEGRFNHNYNYHNIGKDKLIRILEKVEEPVAAVATKHDENGKKDMTG